MHGLSCSVARGIFLDQGSNLCLLHWQADSLPLSHQGSFNILSQQRELRHKGSYSRPLECLPRAVFYHFVLVSLSPHKTSASMGWSYERLSL